MIAAVAVALQHPLPLRIREAKETVGISLAAEREANIAEQIHTSGIDHLRCTFSCRAA